MKEGIQPTEYQRRMERLKYQRQALKEILDIKDLIPSRGTSLEDRTVANREIREKLPSLTDSAIIALAFLAHHDLSMRELRRRLNEGKEMGLFDLYFLTTSFLDHMSFGEPYSRGGKMFREAVEKLQVLGKASEQDELIPILMGGSRHRTMYDTNIFAEILAGRDDFEELRQPVLETAAFDTDRNKIDYLWQRARLLKEKRAKS